MIFLSSSSLAPPNSVALVSCCILCRLCLIFSKAAGRARGRAKSEERDLTPVWRARSDHHDKRPLMEASRPAGQRRAHFALNELEAALARSQSKLYSGEAPSAAGSARGNSRKLSLESSGLPKPRRRPERPVGAQSIGGERASGRAGGRGTKGAHLLASNLDQWAPPAAQVSRRRPREFVARPTR